MKLTMPWTATQAHTNGAGGALDDVRRALSKEVDHLAQMAAQLGHDIGEQANRTTRPATEATQEASAQAATVAQEAERNAGRFARQLMTGAAAIGPQLALIGRRRVRDLGRDAQKLGEDLRHVRLTTEPKRSGPDLMPGIALLGGFGAGLALMYFLDPDQGRRRRALLGDQLAKWTRIGRETAEGKAKDLRNRTVGAVHEVRRAVVPVQPEQDETTVTESPAGYGYGYQAPTTSGETSDEQLPSGVG